MTRDVAREGNGALVLSGASQTLVAANLCRTELTIQNNGAAIMWLAFDDGSGSPAAVANTGLSLAAGASFTTSEYRGAVRIIGTSTQVATWVEF